jgi:dihydroorotase
MTDPAGTAPFDGAPFDVVLTGVTPVGWAGGTGPVDVGIRSGIIAAIEPTLDRSGASVVDGAGGHVSAGFIDAHTHVFEHVSTVGAPVEAAHLRRGVVAVADAGTAGASTFSAFREYVVEPTPMRVLSFLNVSVLGLIDFRYGELLNPDTLQPDDALEISAANPEIVRGFKIRLSEDVVGGPCVPMLRTAVEIGEAGGLPLMVHIGETAEPLPAVLDEMRAGDVVSHCYTGRKNGIVDDAGVLKEVVAARDRGVVFDSAHGRGNLSFDVARRAIDEGFLPDVLSSDTSARNWHGPVFDLATTMSKFLAMGLSLDQVVALVTEAPARLLGLWDEGFGRLEVGAPAHLTVFELVEESEFRDAAGATLRGPRLEPRWAFLAGEAHPADAWRGAAMAT